MSRKNKINNSLFSYECGVCGKCGYFLTDCICHYYEKRRKPKDLYDFIYDEPQIEVIDNIDTGIEYTEPIVALNEYSNFEELKNSVRNDSYKIEVKYVKSPISIVAPHGGNIEVGTTEMTKIISGDTYNFYTFNGIPNDSDHLHITSHNFDEPVCIKLVNKSKYVVTIHGCSEQYDVIFIGGRLTEYKNIFAEVLRSHNILVFTDKHRFQGVHKNNVCNLGRLKKGIQIEVSESIRYSDLKLTSVANAIKEAVSISFD